MDSGRPCAQGAGACAPGCKAPRATSAVSVRPGRGLRRQNSLWLTEELPLTAPGWVVRAVLSALPSQEETPQGEGAEQEPCTPDTEDDGRRHGFLILSREDSTMVRAWGRVPGRSPCRECASPPSPTDPADRAGDHGAGHQWLRHAGPHGVCRQHRRQPLHCASVAAGHPPAGRRWAWWAQPGRRVGWRAGAVCPDWQCLQ